MSRLILMPRKLLAYALAASMAIVSLAGVAHAQRGQWERLASKTVNMLLDRDVIQLDRRDGRFNALRLSSVRGNIKIYRIRVTFGNGERQDLDVNKEIREGDETVAIDLRGKARVIDKIEMLYASSNLLKRAQLEIYGRARSGTRQADAGDDRNRRSDNFDEEPRRNANKRQTARNDDDREQRNDSFDDEPRLTARNDNQPLRDASNRRTGRDDEPRDSGVVVQTFAGWEKLGQRNIDLDFNSDRIWIGRNESRYDKLVLRAKGGEIRVRDIKVVYANGQVNDIRVRSRVREGKMSDPLTLKGRHRGIRRVEVTYRRGKKGARPVMLEVFALPALNIPAAPDPEDAFDEDVTGSDNEGWQVLGSREVDLERDRDVVRIGRSKGPFDAIALRARDESVFVYDIRVTFGNGKRQLIRVDERLRRGTQSKALNLKGNARRITKVELLYRKARSRGGRATIEVVARKAERRAGNKKRNDSITGDDGLVRSEPKPRGWSSVGRRILNARSTDGKIGPAGHVERFSEIVFRVVGGPIRINTATIQFRNGRTMQLKINGTMRDGDKTNPLKFRDGRARRIEGILLDYEPLRGRREVMVEVIGKQAPYE